MKLAAVALVPLLATAGPAAADPDVSIGVAAGARLPTGELGVVVDYSPAPWLTLEGGAGEDLGEYQHDGVQTALTVRGRANLGGPFRAFFGVGGSMGRVYDYTEDDVCFFSMRGCKAITDGFAVWTHIDFGLEVDSEHVFARVYAGARWLDDPARVCVEPEDPTQPCRTAGFFGVAAGARI